MTDDDEKIVGGLLKRWCVQDKGLPCAGSVKERPFGLISIEQQDGREHPVDLGESDADSKDAADLQNYTTWSK
jgi:hypothetical protein